MVEVVFDGGDVVSGKVEFVLVVVDKLVGVAELEVFVVKLDKVVVVLVLFCDVEVTTLLSDFVVEGTVVSGTELALMIVLVLVFSLSIEDERVLSSVLICDREEADVAAPDVEVMVLVSVIVSVAGVGT